jgi:hypothetical protein
MKKFKKLNIKKPLGVGAIGVFLSQKHVENPFFILKEQAS